MKNLFLFLAPLLLISDVYGFSAGVPPLPKVCKSVSPQHGNYTPQLTESPFTISVAPATVVAGDTATVTLKSTDERKFKGFYIQGRGENGKPIGTFRTNKFTEVHSCGGVRWNGAHHASGKVEKDLVTIIWESPKNYEGEINFIGAFVQNYVTIWTGVYTDSITIVARNETQQGTRGGIGSSGSIFRRPLQIKTSFLTSASQFFSRILRPGRLFRLLSNNNNNTIS